MTLGLFIIRAVTAVVPAPRPVVLPAAQAHLRAAAPVAVVMTVILPHSANKSMAIKRLIVKTARAIVASACAVIHRVVTWVAHLQAVVLPAVQVLRQAAQAHLPAAHLRAAHPRAAAAVVMTVILPHSASKSTAIKLLIAKTVRATIASACAVIHRVVT